MCWLVVYGVLWQWMEKGNPPGRITVLDCTPATVPKLMTRNEQRDRESVCQIDTLCIECVKEG